MNKTLLCLVLCLWTITSLFGQLSPREVSSKIKAQHASLFDQSNNSNSGLNFGTGDCDINMPPEFENIIQIGGDGSNVGTCMVTNSSNEFYVAGYFHKEVELVPGTTISSIGLGDLFLAKYDASGNLMWVKTADTDMSGRVSPNAITLDNNGNIYITGSFTGQQLSFDGSQYSAAGEVTSFVCRYNPNGDFSWADVSVVPDYKSGIDIEVSTNGNVWMVEASGTRLYNPSRLKNYTATGSLISIWENDTRIEDIHFDGGKIYMTGQVYIPAYFGSIYIQAPNSYNDLFIAKADENLTNFDFATKMEGNTGGDSGGHHIITKGSDVFVIGYYRNSVIIQGVSLPLGTSQSNTALVKVNQTGALQAVNASLSGTLDHHKLVNQGNDLYAISNVFGDVTFGGTSPQTFDSPTGVAIKINPADLMASTLSTIENSSANKFVVNDAVAWNNDFLTTGSDNFSYSLNSHSSQFATQWTKTAQSDAGLIASTYISTPIIDNNNNIYVAVGFEGVCKVDNQSFFSATPAMLFCKFHTSGSLVWAKEIVGATEDLSQLDEAILELSDNGSHLYLMTNFSEEVTIDNSTVLTTPSDATLITKWDLYGNIIWASQIDYSGNADEFSDLDEGPDGSLVINGVFANSISIGGNSYSSIGSNDVFLAKMDAQGNFLWSKTYQGAQIEYLSYTRLNSLGEIYTLGEYYSDSLTIDGIDYQLPHGDGNIVLIKHEANGNVQWHKSFGGGIGDPDLDYNCWPTGFTIDNNDNLLMSGWTGPANQYGTVSLYNTRYANAFDHSFNWFISKLDASGNVQWANIIEKKRYDWLSYESHGVDADGNSYITGRFRDSIYISGDLFEPDGFTDAITLKYDENGNFEWGKKISASGYSFPSGIAVIEEDKLLIHFTNSGHLDFCTETRLTGNSNSFLVVLGQLLTPNEERPSLDAFSVFPNPGTDLVTITGNIEQTGDLNIELIGVTGQELAHYELGNQPSGDFTKSIDIKHLTAGTYFIKLTVNDQSYWQKVIKL